MSKKLKTKWIEDNAVTEAKILLANNGALKGRNAADTGNVNILKVSGDDTIQMASFFRTPNAKPQNGLDVVNVDYVTSAIASIDLDSLSNVTISSSASNGDFLKLSGEQWINAPINISGGATTLNQLNDVTLSGSSVGQVLKYNGSEWINSSDLPGSAGLNGLSDVTISDATKIEGALLTYDGIGIWRNLANINDFLTSAEISTDYVQSSALTDYVQSSTLTDYLTSAEINTDYVQSSALVDYVQSSTLTDYVQSSTLVDYLTSAEISTDYVNSSELTERYTDYVVVTATISSAKQVSLTAAPISASATALDVIGGVPQEYGVDFAVSGNILTWNVSNANVTEGMTDVVESGDRFRVIYTA